MRRAEYVAALILAVLSVYMMWKSGQSSWGDGWGQNIGYVEGEGPSSGFWPFWLSAAMLGCCVWIVINGMLRKSPPSRSEERFLDAYGMLMLLKVGGGVAAFVASIHLIGVYGAMTLFLIYYIYFLGRHRLVTALAIAFSAPVATFFFFDVAMRIVLPKGYTEPLFIPLYDIFL